MQSPKKVLVVESDAVVLVLISHILTRQSYQVTTSIDALEADRMLQSAPYDALIVDTRIANGGVDLVRRIAARDAGFLRKTVVLATGVDDAESLAHLPVGAVVRKPIEVSDLVDIVRARAEA